LCELQVLQKKKSNNVPFAPKANLQKRPPHSPPLANAFQSLFSIADRCVSKYLESQQLVGAVLQKANEAQIAQNAQMQAGQQQMGR
jgi:hypothetical protein